MTRNKRNKLTGLLLITPAFIALVLLIFFPIAWSFYLSINANNSVLSNNYNLVGIDNYKKVFTTSAFWHSMTNTLSFVVVTVSIEIVLGFIIANTLYKNLPGMKFFRTLTATPLMMSSLAAGYIWKLIFADNNGVLLAFLNFLKIKAPMWFVNSVAAKFMVLITSLWSSLPFVCLVFLAGMHSIPNIYYEAAIIDGASGWKRFRFITFPLMLNVMLSVVIIRVSDSFKIMDTVFALTRGGPGNATRSITYWIYQRAYNDFRFGESTASSFIMLVIVAVSCLLLLHAFRFMKNDD